MFFENASEHFPGIVLDPEKRTIRFSRNRFIRRGVDREFLLSRSMLSPATCCLINPDGEKTVEKAFRMF